ncbi:MAG: Fic family protein [Sediminibacterium sp.]|nr:Fic family protein [Sediminibacterium sp.]
MKNKPSRSGHYEIFGDNEHFVPSSLPPVPNIQLDKELLELYGEAMQSLGKFAEAQSRIPSKRQFLDVYVAKEAVYTSQIENINTTLTQILEYNPKQKTENKNVQEVLNYINALQHGIHLLREKSLPISSRLIRECHAKLLSGVRGESKSPGQYRKVPVFVGSLVPPPAHYVENLIADLEKFIHEDTAILPLIKTGLAHVQFETIHPFLDGNGRIGRLLLVLMLLDYGIINEPVLYPSFYFMKYRSEYYDRLEAVRTKSDYEGWIKFYLRGVRSSAEDIVKRAWAIDTLLVDCTRKIETEPLRSHANAYIVLEQLCHTPVLTINDVIELTGSAYNTAQKLVTSFVNLGILELDKDIQRNKTYTFRKYLDILEKEFTG